MMRSLRLLAKAHPTLPYLSQQSLDQRQGTLTLGKRHTLMRPTYRGNQETTKEDTTSSFHEFKESFKALPQMQVQLEEEIVEERAKQLSPLEQEELLHSWKLRKAYEGFHKFEPREFMTEPEVEDTPFELLPDEKFIIPSVEDSKEKNIGKFLEIPREEARDYFSNGIFGNIVSDQYARSSRIGVMLRDETQHILSWINEPENDQYSRVYSEVAESLRDTVYQLGNAKLESILRNSSEINDFLVDNVTSIAITHGQDFKGLVSELCAALIKGIPDQDTGRSLTIKDFLTYISPQITFQFKKQELKPKKTKLSLSKNILLTGQRGCGKSQILTYLAYWALKQPDWVVIKVPRGTDFTKNATPLLWHPSGLYLQPEVAYDLLLDISTSNSEKLDKIAVNRGLYGQYNLAGMHDVHDQGLQPLPAQHTFLRDLQAYTDDWKQFYPKEILDEIMKVKELTLLPRHKRIDYEFDLLDNVYIPQVFAQRMKDPDYHKDFDIEYLFSPHKSKRKPKKFMLPKVSDDELKFRYKLPPIHGQDLNIIKEITEVQQGNQATRLSQALPTPGTLRDIADFGLENHIYATNAIFELLLQLYRTDQTKVLVLVDEFNEFFKKTSYPSLKYANYKETKNTVPPYDIALCRAFMRPDGHMIRNGLKIVATSEKHWGLNKSHWTRGMGVLNDKFCITVGNMALDDLRNTVHFYHKTEWMPQHFTESEIEDIYMRTQGNFYHTNTQIAVYDSETY